MFTVLNYGFLIIFYIMPRVLGTNIPDNKRMVIALTYVYGIGLVLSKKILKEVGISENKNGKELSMDEIKIIQQYVDGKYKVEGNLRRQVAMSIKKMKDVNSYRGIRHSKKLPCRGQRTKTNSRTIRGRAKMSAGSGKRKLTKK